MSRLRILYVAVNLWSADRSGVRELALEQEFAAIQRELLLTRHRDFELIHARAVTIDDVMRLLIEQEPLVLHFAGHGHITGGFQNDVGSRLKSRDIGEAAEGNVGGIYLRDEQDRPQLVTIPALTMMIKSAAPAVQLIVLNACYSDAQAGALCDVVDCVISMAGAVGDDAARSFSAALYRALGNRRSVGNAFAHAVATLDSKRFPDKALPVCRTRYGFDADQMFLARRQARQPVCAQPISMSVKRSLSAVAIVTIALAMVAAAAGIGSLIQVNNRMSDMLHNSTPPPPSLKSEASHVGAEPAGEPTTADKPERIDPRPLHGFSSKTPEKNRSEIRKQPESSKPRNPTPAPRPEPSREEVTRAPAQPGPRPPNHADRSQDAAAANQPNIGAAAPKTSLGELDRALIQRYVNSYYSQIKYCYERKLMAKPMLAGTVTVQFTVTPEGTVAESVADGMDADVSSCVAGVIKNIEFPRSGSSIVVKTPFRFVPSGG